MTEKPNFHYFDCPEHAVSAAYRKPISLGLNCPLRW
jgi:hypothetical protein